MMSRAAALAASAFLCASSAFGQGTDQTSSNQGVAPASRAGAQSTSPATDPLNAPVLVPAPVIVAPAPGVARAELPNAGGPAGGEAR